MIWSNGRFRAPLHRVLTDPSKERYSAPFFYNPGYNELISPLPCGCRDKDWNGTDTKDLEPKKYLPCLWGYFRAVRFAGDLTDLGVEIQTSHYKMDVGSGKVKDEKRDNEEELSLSHVEKQRKFLDCVDFREAFDVEKYRDILQS